MLSHSDSWNFSRKPVFFFFFIWKWIILLMANCWLIFLSFLNNYKIFLKRIGTVTGLVTFGELFGDQIGIVVLGFFFRRFLENDKEWQIVAIAGFIIFCCCSTFFLFFEKFQKNEVKQEINTDKKKRELKTLGLVE